MELRRSFVPVRCKARTGCRPAMDLGNAISGSGGLLLPKGSAGHLFDEFLSSFEQLKGAAPIASHVAELTQNTVLLLRACLQELAGVESNIVGIMDRCKKLSLVLLSVRECAFLVKDGARIHDTLPPSAAIAILEVIIDSLVKHRELRQQFVATERCLGGTTKISFDGCLGDFGFLLELVCWHFLMCTTDEKIDLFANQFSWTKDFWMCSQPQLSLDAALFLSRTAFLSKAPWILQAYLLLLSSHYIHVGSARSNDINLSRCINALELSLKLYESYTPHLSGLDDAICKGDTGYISKMVPFNLLVHPETYSIIKSKISKNFPFSQPILPGSYAAILGKPLSFLEEEPFSSCEQVREDAASFWDHMVSRISTLGDNDTLDGSVHCTQEMICLASALKLMSTSLMQALRLIVNDCNGMLKSAACRDEYKIIREKLNCFENYGVRKMLIDTSGKDPVFKCSPLVMLEHFAGLSLYSKRKKLSVLWEGSIFMMMTATKLLALELGGFDKLKLIFSCQVSCPGSPSGTFTDERALAIATDFRTTQRTYFTKELFCHGDNAGSVIDFEREEEAGKCDGKVFIECFSRVHKNSWDWSGLEDFIECKEGKDYEDWLLKEEKYRKWKWEKRKSKQATMKVAQAQTVLRKIEQNISVGAIENSHKGSEKESVDELKRKITYITSRRVQ